MKIKVNEEAAGPQIRELRNRKGISLTALAEACGKDISYLSRVENGKINPNAKTIREISEAMGYRYKPAEIIGK